jgi:radical SAM protein with 4Fe4S-binding SPASM domain
MSRFYQKYCIHKTGVILNKIRKNLALIKTTSSRSKLRRAFNEKIFRLSVPLVGICAGWSFWKPRIVGIEPTNRCNLNCIMCARRYWNTEENPSGDMSIELFKEKIFPFLTSRQVVVLQCFGEPLLGAHFFEMLNECKNKGCEVHFTTNGLLLRKYARKLIESEADLIKVSIDGIKSFKNIRGVEIDSIIEGVQELNALKRQWGKSSPVFAIQFVAMKQNISELPELIELAHKLEIEAIGVVYAVVHSKQLIDQSLFVHTEVANKYFKEARLKARKLGIRISLPLLKETAKFCYQPFEIIFINWNGDVRPCCATTINEENSIKLGNLKYSSLPELWNNLQMRKLRMALLRGKRLHGFCKRCAMRVNSLASHTRILKKN